MNAELALVTEWLLSASSRVGSDYFQLPVAGSEEPQYRERVYCYELYHRWRCHWPDGFPFSLCGEVDKSNHPIIRGAVKPDFLVHVPGEMKNLLAVEVKPANADERRMVDDLRKLTTFRRDLYDQWGDPGNYYAAYFWVYGVTVHDWPLLRSRILEVDGADDGIDLSLVSCMVHEEAGTAAVVVPWE